MFKASIAILALALFALPMWAADDPPVAYYDDPPVAQVSPSPDVPALKQAAICPCVAANGFCPCAQMSQVQARAFQGVTCVNGVCTLNQPDVQFSAPVSYGVTYSYSGFGDGQQYDPGSSNSNGQATYRTGPIRRIIGRIFRGPGSGGGGKCCGK